MSYLTIGEENSGRTEWYCEHALVWTHADRVKRAQLDLLA